MNLPALCSEIFPRFLIFSPNVSTLVYYSHIAVMVIALFLGIFILMSGKKELANRVFFFTIISFIAWVFLDSVFWAANRSDVIMFVWSLTILIEPLVYIGALYLIYVLASKKDLPFKYKLGIALIYLPVIIFAPTHYTLTGFDMASCLSTEGFFGYYDYIIEFVFTALLVAVAVRKYRQTGDQLLRKQIKYVGIGIFLFLFAFSWGNIISSFTDNWRISQIGLFAMPVFIAFLVYSIVSFKTFNIKLIGTQALVVSLNALIAAQYIFIKTPVSITLNTVTLVLAVFFGYFLIRSVKKDLAQKEKLEQLRLSLEESNLGLANANDKLKSLDKLKSEFLSLAAHQLRSPLTAIKGYSSMLDEGSYGKLQPEQDEAIRRIYTSSQALINIVEDLLNVSKIEQGGMVYSFAPVELGNIVNMVCHEMEIPAKNKNLDFKFTMSNTDKYMVVADAIKLRQVILNLVDNSIKYTPSGFVHVTLKKEADKIVFAVADSGVGISPETKDKLFQKFSRGEGGRLNTGGSGLGLYLAKEISKAHKGDVIIESDGLGKGAVFSLVLPMAGSQTKDFNVAT